MNLSFSKQISEGDTIVVSLCSYYTEIESIIGADRHFELINIDILLFERFSQDSKDEWEDREVIIENVETGYLYAHFIFRNQHRDIIEALVAEIINDSDAVLSQK